MKCPDCHQTMWEDVLHDCGGWKEIPTEDLAKYWQAAQQGLPNYLAFYILISSELKRKNNVDKHT